MITLRIIVAVLLTQLAVQAQGVGASVEGLVTTRASDAPLAKVLLELRSLDAGTARVFSFTTAANGRFVFLNVPPGRYQLTPMRAGYVRGDYGVRGSGGSGLPIVVTAGQQLTALRLTLTPTGTISGRIVNQQGEGIGNVHVKALRFAYQDGRRVLIDVKSVFTDDRGEYRLGWLPPGSYNVSAMHPDGLINPLNLPEIINSSTSFPGTVVTSAGGFNGGGFASTSQGDPAVRSRLELAPGQEYVPMYYPGTVEQRSASVIQVQSGSENGGIDLVLAPMRPGTIVGHIVSPLDGSAALNARMLVQISRNPSFNLETMTVRPDPRTGMFSVSGLAPGSYVISATAGGSNDGAAGYTTAAVAEGTETSVQVTLEQGVSIPARIVFEGDVPPGVRVREIRVSLRLDPLIPGQAETPATAPDDNGNLILRNIIPGQYLVNVSPLMNLAKGSRTGAPPAVPAPTASPFATTSGRGPSLLPSPDDSRPSVRAYVKSIAWRDVDLMNGRLRVEHQSFDDPIAIVVSFRPGDIDGVLVNQRGAPVPGIVALVPDDGRRARIDLYRTVTADATGRFRITGVTPDRYHLFAWDDVETDAWLDPEFLRTNERTGIAVTVSEGLTASPGCSCRAADSAT